MNVRQASQYLGISPDTLYRYITEGEIPAFKLGNRWKLRKTILDRWMERKMTLAVGRRRSSGSSSNKHRQREAAMALLGGKKSKQIVGRDIGPSSIKAVARKATKAGDELGSFGT